VIEDAVNQLAERYLLDTEASSTSDVNQAVPQTVYEVGHDEWTGEALSSV
jgi:hypothetical protein